MFQVFYALDGHVVVVARFFAAFYIHKVLFARLATFWIVNDFASRLAAF